MNPGVQTGDPIFIAQHRLDYLDAVEAIGIDGSPNMFGKRRLRLEADDCHILNGNGEVDGEPPALAPMS